MFPLFDISIKRIFNYTYLNKNPYKLNGQALHAQKISFDHPITKERMEFSVDAPKYFYDLLEKLR